MSEYKECVDFYQWTQQHPSLIGQIFHITNEGKRSKKGTHWLKIMGLSPGVPDYFITIPNKKYHGLWIEMKTSDKKKAKISQHQKNWIDQLNKNAYYATVCYGCYEAIRVTLDYLSDSI